MPVTPSLPGCPPRCCCSCRGCPITCFSPWCSPGSNSWHFGCGKAPVTEIPGSRVVQPGSPVFYHQRPECNSLQAPPLHHTGQGAGGRSGSDLAVTCSWNAHQRMYGSGLGTSPTRKEGRNVTFRTSFCCNGLALAFAHLRWCTKPDAAS